MVKIELKRSRLEVRLDYKKLKLAWTIEPRYWRNPLLAWLALCALPLLSLMGGLQWLSIFTTANLCATIALPLLLQIIGTGRVNLGPQLFVALGGYTAGLLSINYKMEALQTLPIVIVVALLVGLSLSLLTILARGIYFSLITLIIPLVFMEITFVFSDVFKGETGIYGITPLFRLGSHLINSIAYYYASLMILTLYLFLVDKILRSRWGMVYAAINNDEDVAMMMGVDINRHKIFVFTVTSVLTAIAGWFFAHYFGTFAGVTYLPFTFMIKILFIVLIGGRAQAYGTIAGAYFVSILDELLRSYLGNISHFVFPSILLVLLVALPEGLWGIYRKHKYREIYPTIRIRR